MKPKAESQMQELAVFIHGVLFSFHVLGVLYNFKRKNKFDVIAHALAATYDAKAVHHHLSHLTVLNEENQ